MTVPPMNRCSRKYVAGQCERLACHTGPCALTSSDGRWVDPVVWADEATPFTGPEVRDLLQENERLRRVADAAHECHLHAGRTEEGEAVMPEAKYEALCEALRATYQYADEETDPVNGQAVSARMATQRRGIAEGNDAK